jgi:hypothetical protein
MFDTIVNHQKEYVPYTKKVEITEKKAPTDQSIEILKEMEEKILSRIVKNIITDNNILSVSVTFIQDHIGYNAQIISKIKLNNIDYVFTYNYVFFKNIDENMKCFIEELSVFIAQKIFNKMFQQENQDFINAMKILSRKQN